MDALESVGRKTMGILSEGDPRLKRKREMFIKEHPTLSQVCPVFVCTRGRAEIRGSLVWCGVGGREGPLTCSREIND